MIAGHRVNLTDFIKHLTVDGVSLVVFRTNPLALVTAVKEGQEPCAAKELLDYMH